MERPVISLSLFLALARAQHLCAQLACSPASCQRHWFLRPPVRERHRKTNDTAAARPPGLVPRTGLDCLVPLRRVWWAVGGGRWAVGGGLKRSAVQNGYVNRPGWMDGLGGLFFFSFFFFCWIRTSAPAVKTPVTREGGYLCIFSFSHGPFAMGKGRCEWCVRPPPPPPSQVPAVEAAQLGE